MALDGHFGPVPALLECMPLTTLEAEMLTLLKRLIHPLSHAGDVEAAKTLIAGIEGALKATKAVLK